MDFVKNVITAPVWFPLMFMDWPGHTKAAFILMIAYLAQWVTYFALMANPALGGFDISSTGPYYYLKFYAASYVSTPSNGTVGTFDVISQNVADSSNLQFMISSQVVALLMLSNLAYLVMWLITYGQTENWEMTRGYPSYQPVLAIGLALCEIVGWSIIQGVLTVLLGDSSAISFARLIGVVLAFAGILFLVELDRMALQARKRMNNKRRVAADTEADDLLPEIGVDDKNDRMWGVFAIGWVFGLAFFVILFVTLMIQIGVANVAPVTHNRPALVNLALSFHIIDLCIQFIVFSANMWQRVFHSKPSEWAETNTAFMYTAHVAFFADVTVFVWALTGLFAQVGNLA